MTRCAERPPAGETTIIAWLLTDSAASSRRAEQLPTAIGDNLVLPICRYKICGNARSLIEGKPGCRKRRRDNAGCLAQFGYDALDRLARTTDAAGRVTTFGYDTLSRPTSLSNPGIQATALVQQTYTPDGLPATLTDGKNNTTSFNYDRFDRLSTITFPLGSTETFTYDANSNVLTRKTRAGGTITFGYDTLNRLATKTPPSAPVVSYGYDRAGRLRSVDDTRVVEFTRWPDS